MMPLRTRLLAPTIAVALGLTGLVSAGVAQAWSEPNTPPLGEIVGSDLEQPRGIAFDDLGNVYVSNTDNSIVVYPADWKEGDNQPIKVLQGDRTLLQRPTGIAFDSEGRMYVANGGSITAYAADWASGNTAPIKVLFGGGTGLNRPRGIVFDSADRMYVANGFDNFSDVLGSVTVYRPDWPNGNTEPSNTIIGPDTGLNRPWGIAFDPAGRLHVANIDSVTVYFPGGGGGNREPDKILQGPDTGLDRPTDLTFDDEGFMYVANFAHGSIEGSSVTVYDTEWTESNTVPDAVLQGPDTLLQGPRGVAIAFDRRLYVANSGNNFVTVYQANIQRITFERTASVPWTTRSVTVTASATSGLPVALISETPRVCRGQGTSPLTVTILGMGTCTLRGEQRGDPQWDAASPVKQSFTVGKASQSITVADLTDVKLSQHLVRLRGTSSAGLPIFWTTDTPDVCSVRGPFGVFASLKKPGTCTVNASQPGNQRYTSASTVTRSFEITP